MMMMIAGFVTASCSRSTPTEKPPEITRRAQPTGPVKTMAVLPFKESLTGQDKTSVSLGIADSLIARLSNLQQIVLRPTSAVRKFFLQEQDPLEAGRELQVDAVIAGEISEVDDRVKLTAQLRRVQTGSLLWSQTFEVPSASLRTLETIVSEQVAEAIGVELSPQERGRLTKPSTTNPAAYFAIVQGRHDFNLRTEIGLNKAIERFREAAGKDDRAAVAYSELAKCYIALSHLESFPPKEIFPKATQAAVTAINLDKDFPDPHLSLAYIRMRYDFDWKAAEKEFKHALELNPNTALTHQWYSEFLTARGRSDEAMSEIRRAQELDPLSLTITENRGATYYYTRQYDQAIEQLRRVIEQDAAFTPALRDLGLAYRQKGQYDEALAVLQRAVTFSGNKATVALLANVQALAGRRDEAAQLLKSLISLFEQKYASAYSIAVIYAGFGDQAKVFEWLKKAAEQRTLPPTMFIADPLWDNFRSDPRFMALAQRYGFMGGADEPKSRG